MSSSAGKQGPHRFDPMVRGTKGYSPYTLSLFVVLRTLNVPIQYLVLTSPLVAQLLGSLFVRPIAPGIQYALGLTRPRLLLMTITTISALKQSFWAVYLLQEPLRASSAVAVAAINVLSEALNNVLYLWAVTSSAAPGESLTAPMIVGAGIYILGAYVETASELQRKRFKGDSKNKGKLFTGGLFSLARHVNYAGFVTWRAGMTMVAAGWVGGIIGGLIFTPDFVTRAIPVLDDYCSNKYGQQWEEYKKKTPYKMFPGVY